MSLTWTFVRRFGALLGCGALAWTACDPFETTNGTVDKGQEAFEEGSYEEATARFTTAKEELPESAELHFNTGTSLLAEGKLEEAEEELSRGAETANAALRPKVMANLGLARLKRALTLTDEAKKKELLSLAVDALQKSVVADPTVEEVRKNLELALLYLYPPCAKREDAFEENDKAADAKAITETTGKDLLSCPGDADFYFHEFKKGDRVTLKVDSKAAAEVGAPPIKVVDAGGKVVVEESALATSRTVKFTAASEGRYIVEVSSADEEERSYTLNMAVLPDCASMPDPFEANNSRAQAKPVEKGQAQHRICPNDEDYFVQPLKQGESLWVQAQAQMVTGDLSIEVLDAQGNVVSRATRSEQPAQQQSGQQAGGVESGPTLSFGAVLLDVPADADYFVKVAGVTPDSEAGVTLALAVRPPCPAGDDEMEPNDQLEAATDLAEKAAQQKAQAGAAGGVGAAAGAAGAPGAPGAAGAAGGAPTGAEPMQFLLRRCPGNDDWYKLTVKKDAPQQVQIEFQHEKGDLSLSVFEEGKKDPVLESNKSNGSQNGEGAVLAPSKDTTYLLKVTGANPDASNFYRLAVQPPENQNGDKKDQDKDKKDQDKDKKDQDKDKKDQDKKDQDKKEKEKKDQQKKEEEKKPIEQAMDQLDKQKQQNIEAQKALQGQVPSAPGKPW